MSLYSHFAHKEELLDLLDAEIERRLFVDHGKQSWEEELLALGEHLRSVLLEHPHWTRLMARAAQRQPAPVRERVLAMMVSGGRSPAAAFAAFSGFVLATMGFALAELQLEPPDLDDRYRGLREWAEGDDHGAPVTRAALQASPTFGRDALFSATLRALVRGLAPAA